MSVRHYRGRAHLGLALGKPHCSHHARRRPARCDDGIVAPLSYCLPPVSVVYLLTHVRRYKRCGPEKRRVFAVYSNLRL